MVQKYINYPINSRNRAEMDPQKSIISHDWTSIGAMVPSRGVPESGFKSEQPPSSLCAPPHPRKNCDPGGG